MAKISTYPYPSSPKLGDYVIGTDTSDSLNTKNFTISSILGLMDLSAYVPYTGATGNVDLGNYSMYARNFSAEGRFFLETNCVLETSGSTGISGQVLKSTGPSSSPVWASIDISGYVPYTGATTDVDLGVYSLTARRVSVETQVGLQTGAVIYTSGSAGTAGQHLVSQGAGVSPMWESDYVIPTGAVINTSGSEGTAGQVLVSQGTGVSPQWQSLTPTVYRGSFYNTATQTTSANTPTAFLLPSTDATCTSGFSISAGTRITAANTGVYNVAFSAQVWRTAGGSSETIDIWLRKLGTDIPNSNTRIDLLNNSQRTVAAWNFFVQLNVGESVEIMWAVSQATVQLLAEAASGVHPATPSVIVTVNQV